MYNKLVLKNSDKEFTVKFDWVDHNIPSGMFEAEETLGNFIYGQARRWWINVTIETRPEAPGVKEIKEIKEIKEEDVEIKKEKVENKKEEKLEKEEKKESKK